MVGVWCQSKRSCSKLLPTPPRGPVATVLYLGLHTPRDRDIDLFAGCGFRGEVEVGKRRPRVPQGVAGGPAVVVSLGVPRIDFESLLEVGDRPRVIPSGVAGGSTIAVSLGIARRQLKRAIEVGQCSRQVAQAVASDPAVVIGLRIDGIDRQGAVEVGERAARSPRTRRVVPRRQFSLAWVELSIAVPPRCLDPGCRASRPVKMNPLSLWCTTIGAWPGPSTCSTRLHLRRLRGVGPGFPVFRGQRGPSDLIPAKPSPQSDR